MYWDYWKQTNRTSSTGEEIGNTFHEIEDVKHLLSEINTIQEEKVQLGSMLKISKPGVTVFLKMLQNSSKIQIVTLDLNKPSPKQRIKIKNCKNT